MSPMMVAEARENLADFGNVQVSRTDGFSLREFPADSFDLVFSAGMFGYLDPAPALGMLDEVRRVLRPSGHLVFNLELIDAASSGERLLDAARQAARRRHKSGNVERPYCLAQIEAWLQTVDMRLVSATLGMDAGGRAGRTNVVARSEPAREATPPRPEAVWPQYRFLR
jgi:SAM-dependent methyltransferase